MRNRILLGCLGIGALLSSCSTVSNTSSVAPIQSAVAQYPTVANLDVDSQKVEKTVTWNWSIFGSTYSLTQRQKNLTADLLKEKGADVLVEPQYIYTKKSFGPRTLTIYGFPAKLKDFRNATVDDVHAIGLVNGAPYSAEQKTPKKGFLAFLGHKNGAEAGSRTEPTPQKSSNFGRKYLRIGISSMVYHGDYLGTSDHKVGYSLILGKRFRISSLIYYALECGLISRGGDNIDDNPQSQIKHALQVSPITLGLMLPIGKTVKLDAHLGFSASYDYADSYEDSNGNSHSAGNLESYDNKAFDLAYTAGLGLWFKNFNIDFTYREGLRDAYLDSNFDGMQSRNMVFSIGFGF